MSDRPCHEWTPDRWCILRWRKDDPSPAKVCQWFERCMYAAPRSSFTPLQLEYLDSWSHGKLCLLAYRPVDDSPPS